MSSTQQQQQTLSLPSGPDPAVIEAITKGNKVVFFDVTLGADEKGNGGNALGRIKLELYVKDCPKTCENFRQFCTGQHLRNSQPTGYKNSTFHRVMKDFMIQGGDFLNHDGTGKTCIYSENRGFDDENLSLKHDRPGILSMANSGPNTNGSQFFITCGRAEWLDGKHVVFGSVLDADSMLTVRKCEAVPVSGVGNRPRVPLRIVECGEL
eukprot:CAMPEP_0172478960 /NCGR_PEP_ID=MMETSP1066-20121228/3194_1 /TAXON_ID=671091 /ORGANISM="Coscinodiscus wailesii, Strain CCMP2513" /LENGTH=208 /DNA_ID=CAMNT_0013238947 /DNA_START=97 /DNA_END=723 /DNA_ORIENTATION=-